jgi:cytochrome c553
MANSASAQERRWRLWAILGVFAILVTAAGLGFVVLPVVQGEAAGIGAYTAICRALGILPGSPARPTPPSEAAAQPVTRVAWTVATLDGLYRADRTNGARLAEERCVACHMPDGNSADPSIPRNAAQSAAALYKQLQDFRSGARVNETMTPLVAELDDRAIADLAAYYGRLVRGDLDRPDTPPFVGADIENLVSNGDVARGLPPCSACHGTRAGGPIETPTLSGQYAPYLEAQLKAFASGQRHNDIYHRMRSVASKLTPTEMRLLTIYYSGQ